MRPHLSSLTILMLAAAGSAQGPIATPVLRLVDSSPHGSAPVRTASLDPVLAGPIHAAPALVASWTVPSFGGDHPIAPPVPPPPTIKAEPITKKIIP